MKRLLFLILWASTLSLTYGQQLKKIADFNPKAGESYPVYADVKILQATTDGNFMMYRGGNFQDYATVKSLDGVPNLSNLAGLHTESNGLYPPDPVNLPVIPGWEVCYSYDVKWNVIGSGLCKNNIDYKAYENDATLRLYKNRKQAEKQIVTKPDTGPIGPTGTDPEVIIDPAPDSWNIGEVGYHYGSDYWSLLAQIPEGESYFNFYGQPGITYPMLVRKGEKRPNYTYLNAIDLPSHSTTISDFGGTNLISSKVEMELYDDTGRLIWKLYDTKGGIHDKFPNAKRGNNHPDQCTRWIKPGVYKLRFRNMNDDPAARPLRFEFLCTNGTWYNDESIGDGNWHEYSLDMRNIPSIWHSWKLNCNWY